MLPAASSEETGNTLKITIYSIRSIAAPFYIVYMGKFQKPAGVFYDIIH